MIGTKINKKDIDWLEYTKCAEWCNENNCMIEDKGDYYEVVECPAPVLSELQSQKMTVLQSLLSQTDYKQNQYLDGRCTADEYAPIKAKRVAWTDAYHAIEQAKTIEEVNSIEYPTLS